MYELFIAWGLSAGNLVYTDISVSFGSFKVSSSIFFTAVDGAINRSAVAAVLQVKKPLWTKGIYGGRDFVRHYFNCGVDYRGDWYLPAQQGKKFCAECRLLDRQYLAVGFKSERRAGSVFALQPGTVENWLSERFAELGACFAQPGDGLITGSLRYLSVAGRAGTFVVVSFICVVLFAREIEGWQQGLLNLAAIEPAIDHILSILLRIGKKLGNMIKTYMKTQTIILVCISITATVGLYLGGSKEGWFYGLLAGFMDFLPFIGTGIVLIPISVMAFLRGKLGSGVIILLTYFICVIIREFLEPRLLGNGLKFSPVAILISVYAGVIYYGLGGVILGPITLLILVELGREIFVPGTAGKAE